MSQEERKDDLCFFFQILLGHDHVASISKHQVIGFLIISLSWSEQKYISAESDKGRKTSLTELFVPRIEAQVCTWFATLVRANFLKISSQIPSNLLSSAVFASKKRLKKVFFQLD